MNVWSFVTAGHPSMDFNEDMLEQAKTPADLLRDIRTTLLQRGSTGIRGLARLFVQMD